MNCHAKWSSGILEYWVEEACASLELNSDFDYQPIVPFFHHSIIPVFPISRYSGGYLLPLSLGSRESLSPSPTRLKERTMIRIASPGKTVNHHASKM
jgi:hypothetical protein